MLLFSHLFWLSSISLYAQTSADDAEFVAKNTFPSDEFFEEELPLWDEEDMLVSAVGYRQYINRAPAVATVITAEDMKNMGATNIEQVLETVPGLHVSLYHSQATPIYSFRGIYGNFNPQVLVMLNGIPLTNLDFGRPASWDGFQVEALSRIEVIRGPGSAVYGAEAFAGTINLITKSADEVKGFEGGVRYGSFDTKDGWLSYGGDIAGFKTALFLGYHKTDGHKERINADAQSYYDGLAGTSASHAPGSVNLYRDDLDLRLDILRGDWQLRAGLQQRRDMGNYAGVAQALDPNNRYAHDRWNADLTWHDSKFTDDWDLKAQISYLETVSELDGSVLTLFPAGTNPDLGRLVPTGLPAPNDFAFIPVPDGVADGFVYPNGLIGNPERSERHYRFEFAALFSGISKHLIRLGAGWHYGDLYEVKETKNFGIKPTTGAPVPPNSPIFSVTDTPYVYMPEKDRKNYHWFAQDVWALSTDWELTTGIRYDKYSDFGHTYNPRAALVWTPDINFTTKLLYGEAFRSPSFVETYAQNNPAVLGNSDLKPETIKTTELAFSYSPVEPLQLDLNMFYYDWESMIEFIPDPGGTTITAQNAGRQTGYGLEFSTDWEATSKLHLRGNYAWQRSKDEDINRDSGNAPRHQLYLRADWKFMPDWHLNTQVNWVGERERVTGDARNPVDDFTTVDLTLRRSNIAKNWEVAVSAHNLFDEDVREPSLNATPQPFIPNDLPQAGRSIFAEIRFRY